MPLFFYLKNGYISRYRNRSKNLAVLTEALEVSKQHSGKSRLSCLSCLNLLRHSKQGSRRQVLEGRFSKTGSRSQLAELTEVLEGRLSKAAA